MKVPLLIATGLVIVGFAVFLSRDVRRVWRGDRLRYLPLYVQFFDVTHRSFAVMVTVLGGLGVVCLLAGVAGALWDRPPGFAGGVVLSLVVLMLGGMALAGVIEATNRPRFLVPPPHRRKAGSTPKKRPPSR